MTKPGKNVDLAYYDEDGTRHVIGEAVVETDENDNIIVGAEVRETYTHLFHDPGASYSIGTDINTNIDREKK